MISVALWNCLFSLPLADCFSHFRFFIISLSLPFLFFVSFLFFSTSSHSPPFPFIFTHPLPRWQTFYCDVYALHVETMTLIILAQFYLWNADATSENCSGANIANEDFKLAQTEILSK